MMLKLSHGPLQADVVYIERLSQKGMNKLVALFRVEFVKLKKKLGASRRNNRPLNHCRWCWRPLLLNPVVDDLVPTRNWKKSTCDYVCSKQLNRAEKWCAWRGIKLNKSNRLPVWVKRKMELEKRATQLKRVRQYWE